MQLRHFSPSFLSWLKSRPFQHGFSDWKEPETTKYYVRVLGSPSNEWCIDLSQECLDYLGHYERANFADTPACTNPPLECNAKILCLFPVREQFCGELLPDCFSGLFIEHSSFDLGLICLGVPLSPLRYCYAWNGGAIS